MKKTLLNALAVGLTSMAFVGGLSAQDYPLSDAAKSSRGTDRPIEYLSITGATVNNNPVEFKTIIAGEGSPTQDRVYYDNTVNVLDATKGDQIVVSPKKGFSWMHYYLFIDYNQNKQFEENELVSFSHFQSTEGWVDSKGATVDQGTMPDNMPDFTIPEDALKGETRARFVCQWNSKDPMGASNIASDRGTICDFTINIHEKGEVVVIATEKLPLATVTPEGGKFDEQVEVTINHETDGVTLHYTTDGNNPSKSSPVYSDKLTFTESTTLKVIAIKEGFKPSDVAKFQFVKKFKDAKGYEIWDEKSFPRTDTDRVLQQIVVEGATLDGDAVEFKTIVAGEDATTQSKSVFDNTADVLNVTIGDEIAISPKQNGSWIHYYVYIDYNKNKIFEDDELVSFSHFSATPADNSTFTNSLGESVDPGTVPEKLPIFTIKEGAEEGETRIRVKSDYNNKEAAGNPGPNDRFDQNRSTMCDFTINIHKKSATKKAFAVKYTADEEGGTVTLKKEDGTVVAPDTKVEEGTKLTLEVVAKEGKTIEKVIINGQEVTLTEGKAELTVSEALDIQVTYGEVKKSFVVKYETETENGTVTLKKEDGTVVAPNTEVEEGTKLTLEVAAKEGKTIEKVVVNGKDVTLTDNKAELTVSGALDIQVSYKTTAIAELDAKPVKVYAKSGSIVVEGAKQGVKAFVYNTQGTLVDTILITNSFVQGTKLHTGIYLVKIGANTYKVIL